MASPHHHTVHYRSLFAVVVLYLVSPTSEAFRLNSPETRQIFESLVSEGGRPSSEGDGGVNVNRALCFVPPQPVPLSKDMFSEILQDMEGDIAE